MSSIKRHTGRSSRSASATGITATTARQQVLSQQSVAANVTDNATVNSATHADAASSRKAYRANNTQTANRKTRSRWTYTPRGYAVAQSLRQLAQAKLSSIGTLLVFGITLALPALILLSASSLATLGAGQLQKESLTAYLDVSISDLDGAAIAGRLNSRAGIASTSYISSEEALAVFRAQADIGDALDALGENPLPGAIIIYPEQQMLTESRMQRLAETIVAQPEVSRVQLDLLWVQRLQSMLALAKTIGWLLAGFLTLTALLVISNTIRLELHRRQREVEISELLGGRRSFINRPLLYSGALYGFLGGVVATIIALASLHWLQLPANQLAELYGSAFKLKMPTASQIFAVIGAGTLLGIVAAIFTLYRPSRQLLPIGTK